MSVTIEVTQEDIDKARQRRSMCIKGYQDEPDMYVVCRDCAIALAVTRVLGRPTSWAFSSGWYTDIVATKRDRESLEALNGNMVTKMVDLFDNEHAGPIWLSPFTFELEVTDA